MADFCGFGRIDFVAKTTGKDVFSLRISALSY